MTEEMEIKRIAVDNVPSNEAGLLGLSCGVIPHTEYGITIISLTTEDAGENLVMML